MAIATTGILLRVVLRRGSERMSVGRKVFYVTLFVVAFPFLGAAQAGACEDLEDDVFWARRIGVPGCGRG